MKMYIRSLLLVFILSVFPNYGTAAIAYVQCVHGDWSSGATWTTSITGTSTNLFAVSVHFASGDTSNDLSGTPPVSDGTNTYTQVDTFTANIGGTKRRVSTFYAKNITGGALTVTTSAATSTISQARTTVCEVSGADTTAPLDVNTGQQETNPGAGTDDVDSGAVVTTTDGQYIFAATLTTANGTFTAGTGYTLNGTPTLRFASEQQIQVSAGSVNGTFTHTAGAAETTFTAIMTFKAAAAAGGGGVVNCMLLGVC